MMTSVSVAGPSGEEPRCPSSVRSIPKRSTSSTPLLQDPTKKRRKQSTPVRISTPDAAAAVEGKLLVAANPIPSPLRCPMCRLTFDAQDHLQLHVQQEHRESAAESSSSDGGPMLNSALAPGIGLPSWIMDVQNKTEDWLNTSANPLQRLSLSPMYLSQFADSNPSQGQRQPGQPPVRIFNPDAYCDLCNKEFCNKYFLKTHKANKHRIYVDPPATDTIGAPINLQCFSNVKTPETPKVGPKLEPITTICDTVKKSCNKYFLVNQKSMPCPSYEENTSSVGKNEKDDDEGRVEARSVDLPTYDENVRNGHEKEEVSEDFLEQDLYGSRNCKTPEQSRESSEAVNRLRRLGIMNPEAFCEICCKEYCNKYFLRTHKSKRHGITMPDDNIKDNPKDMSGGNGWYQTQTSPLNLIMGEQSTNSSGSYSERKESAANSETECACGIKFSTAYLAQLHMISEHCKKFGDETEATQTVKTESMVNNNERNATVAPPATSDFISEDLQKLQTMILQLNSLETGKSNPTVCNMCGKEFENRYYLHCHMSNDHGILLENNSDEKVDDESPVDAVACRLCGCEGLTPDSLKQHLMEIHGGDLLPETNSEEQTTSALKSKPVGQNNQSNQPGERRLSTSAAPTSSYCEICNKELCNKYFMKTHMQRMHGIEIENGAQIGGVVCNICNKELCSKYFLRVHKHNTHGIVGDSMPSQQSTTRQAGEAESNCPETTPDPALKPSDLADLSHRYFAHFTEVCPVCSRRFRSPKWLKAHLLGDHGKIGAEKWAELENQMQATMGPKQKANSGSGCSSPTMPKITNGDQDAKQPVKNVLSSLFGADDSTMKSYHCSYCPFSTPVLAFLFVHERSHAQTKEEAAPQAPQCPQCPVCSRTFQQAGMLQQHMITHHSFLSLQPFYPAVTNASSSSSSIIPPHGSSPPEVDRSSSTEQECPTCKSRQPDLVVSLKDLAKQSRLPATYALPQGAPPDSIGRYVMQAFLLDEPTSTTEDAATINIPTPHSGAPSERKFVPSVVFLPVVEKLTTPLTVSFTLTPA